MEKILIFVKHHFKFLWRIIEWSNGIFFRIFYTSDLEVVLSWVFRKFSKSPYLYRRINKSDVETLSNMINSQIDSDLEYFNPHSFDLKSIKKQLNNPAFLMMGVFDDKKIVGYFFLRFFVNKKCFVGRLIDKEYRGKGIGEIMNQIMYEAAWKLGFRCFSTISLHNKAVLLSHAKNKKMVIVKKLQNDFMLVEFVMKENLEITDRKANHSANFNKI